MIGAIKNVKSVKCEHRFIDDSNESRSFGFCEKDLDPSILNFETVRMFLQNAVSKDYVDVLPDNFFKLIYSVHDKKKVYDVSRMSNMERDRVRTEYSNKVANLSYFLQNAIKKYYSIVKASDYIGNYVDIDHQKFTINNMLSLASQDEDHRYPVSADIKYDDFPSLSSHISNNELSEKALSDVRYILSELSDLGIMSGVLDGEENTYSAFASKIIMHMYGNTTQVYPRSILNHSAFKFCIEQYPYNTLSRRVYSVSNVPKNIKNKFELVELYCKNMDAILNFLSDLTFDEINRRGEGLNEFDFEVKTLVNAYGICIALCGIYAEQKLYDDYTRSFFKKSNSI